MKALIKQIAQDEGLPAIVEIDGNQFEAMDCLGYGGNFTNGEELEVEFTMGLDDENESWEEIFQGNQKQEKKLVNKGGWSYRALGEIISINPVVIDCGIQCFEGVIDTKDERCIGSFVGFNILRLNVWAKSS